MTIIDEVVLADLGERLSGCVDQIWCVTHIVDSLIDQLDTRWKQEGSWRTAAHEEVCVNVESVQNLLRDARKAAEQALGIVEELRARLQS